MHFLCKLDAEKPLELESAHHAVQFLRQQILTCSADGKGQGAKLVGLEELVDRMLVAMICGGHCLLEGNPGLAKTLACSLFGHMAGLVYKRIQFVPDLMPTDLLMKEFLSYVQDKPHIMERKGPVFTNILLADEINRASPKLQSSLLEGMQEGRATLLYRSSQVIRPFEPLDEAEAMKRQGPFFGLHRLDPSTRDGQVFVVVATQNPIEQEGVYPLAQAQLRRFLFKCVLECPSWDQWAEIERHAFQDVWPKPGPVNEEDHVKTLYFFHALRQLLFGRQAQQHWFSDGNESLRQRARALAYFTWYCWQRDESNGAGTFVPAGAARDGAVKATLTAWSNSSERKLRDRANRLLNLLGDAPKGPGPGVAVDGYPEIASGAPPSSMVTYIRAAQAHAFLRGHLDGSRLGPRWDDFRHLAHDVLRHRIRLTPGSEAVGARTETVIDTVLGWIDQCQW